MGKIGRPPQLSGCHHSSTAALGSNTKHTLYAFCMIFDWNYNLPLWICRWITNVNRKLKINETCPICFFKKLIYIFIHWRHQILPQNEGNLVLRTSGHRQNDASSSLGPDQRRDVLQLAREQPGVQVEGRLGKDGSLYLRVGAVQRSGDSFPRRGRSPARW